MLVSLPLQILACYLLLAPAALLAGLPVTLLLPVALVTGPVLLTLSYLRFLRREPCAVDDADMAEEAQTTRGVSSLLDQSNAEPS